VTNLNPVPISGTAQDSDGTVNQITCKNTTTGSSSTVTTGSVLPAASTTWNTSVVLQGGINDVSITATDNFGNITVVNRTIIYDQSSPS
jgi:hypothetical protein